MVRLASIGLSLCPLLIAACGTEPSTPPLIGRWGNSMVEVVARAPVVELHLACSTNARFRGPLRPDEDGRFRLRGRARHFWGTFDVELVGVVQGNRLGLTLTRIYESGRETSVEELMAGVMPDFPGVVCLA